MSDGTGISWCDATWPIVAGCTHLSPGCEGCWSAFHTSGRLRHRPEYSGLATGGHFTGQVRLLPERLTWPTRWTRKPRKVFVASAADLFHEDVPDAFIAAAWVVMYRTGQPTYGGRHRAPLVFQVLTKRHARSARRVPGSPTGSCRFAAGSGDTRPAKKARKAGWDHRPHQQWPPRVDFASRPEGLSARQPPATAARGTTSLTNSTAPG